MNNDLANLGLKSKFIINTSIITFFLNDDKYKFSQNRTIGLISILAQVYYVNLINKVIKKFKSKTGIALIKVTNSGSFRYRHKNYC